MQVVAVMFRVVSAIFFMLQVGGFFAGRLTPYQSLIINCACFRSIVEAFMYLPGLIFYSKMVPHHIETMMMGFALGIIKFNADVVGRCFTAALNIHFKVMMEAGATGHSTSEGGSSGHSTLVGVAIGHSTV